MSTRILLVDDHRMFLDGLRQMISRRPEYCIVGEASSGAAALAQVKTQAPEVVLMDIQLPDANGIEVSRQLLSENPDLRIMVVSSVPDPEVISEAMQTGIAGYVLKTSTAEELFIALQAVIHGQVYLCPEVATHLVNDYRKVLAAHSQGERPLLSPRECEVLRFIAEGLRAKEIADKLGVGVKSVETYRARLMTKLECHSTAELTRYAIRQGIIKL